MKAANAEQTEPKSKPEPSGERAGKPLMPLMLSPV